MKTKKIVLSLISCGILIAGYFVGEMKGKLDLEETVDEALAERGCLPLKKEEES